MQKLNLRELKGAPLSIILAIVMAGNRNVSVSYLVTTTGYSDKTINSGLDLLRDRQIVTQTGRCRYQLTGENVQLPLYWGETVEPADPSPACDQPALFELGDGVGNFSGKISRSGKFPESGKIPELEYRLARLEKRVSDIETGKNSGFLPEKVRKTVEIPAETGDFPDDDIKSSSIKQSNLILQVTDDEKPAESGNFPDPESDDRDADGLNEYERICCDLFREYNLARNDVNNGHYEDGIKWTNDEAWALIDIHADPKLFEFILPRAADFEAAKKWLGYKSMRTAKYFLCKKFGIYKNLQREFADRNDIDLYAIDFHYWNWRLHESDNPKITLGSIISRIDKHFDEARAKSTDWLKDKYLDLDETAVTA